MTITTIPLKENLHKLERLLFNDPEPQLQNETVLESIAYRLQSLHYRTTTTLKYIGIEVPHRFTGNLLWVSRWDNELNRYSANPALLWHTAKDYCEWVNSLVLQDTYEFPDHKPFVRTPLVVEYEHLLEDLVGEEVRIFHATKNDVDVVVRKWSLSPARWVETMQQVLVHPERLQLCQKYGFSDKLDIHIFDHIHPEIIKWLPFFFTNP